MKKSNLTQLAQIAKGFVALLVLVAVLAAILYGLSLTGAAGGAVAGGLVGLGVTFASKAFEHRKQQDSAIAEKKRDVYRRLLAPWEQMLVNVKAGKQGDDLMNSIDLSAIYASAFDAVLYGSEAVVQRYVDLRTPNQGRDGIDTLRAIASLLVAMREDVTGRKSALSVEAVLGTFMNFSDQDRVLLRLREYAAGNPEAQKLLARALAETSPNSPDSSGTSTSTIEPRTRKS